MKAAAVSATGTLASKGTTVEAAMALPASGALAGAELLLINFISLHFYYISWFNKNTIFICHPYIKA